MSIGNSIRAQIPPIHPEGYPFIGGFAHLVFARIPAAVTDIVGDGVVEEHSVLRHHADRGAH